MPQLFDSYSPTGAAGRARGTRPAVLVAGVLALCCFSPAGSGADSGPSPLVVEGLTDVLSLDLYPERGKIHALVAGRFSGHNLPMLAYLASADGGSHWTQPVFLNREGEPAIASRRGNDVQLAASGPRLVAAWQERGSLPGSGPLRLAYSGDFGRTWARSNLPALNDPANSQSYPDLAADAAGAFHLVWLDDREENGNTQGLRYVNSADGGRSWAQQKTVDQAVCTCCWNRVGTLPDQSVGVLYRDDDPHDMRLARRSAGGDWRDAGAVGRFDWHFSGCPHCGGGFAHSGDRRDLNIHSVVWTGLDKAPGLYYLHSRSLGKSWSRPERLGDGNSREADIAVLSPRRIAVVYGAPRGGANLIHARLSRDGGRTWSMAQVLSSPTAAADHPRILATPYGLRAFWTERRADGGKSLAMRSLDS